MVPVLVFQQSKLEFSKTFRRTKERHAYHVDNSVPGQDHGRHREGLRDQLVQFHDGRHRQVGYFLILTF